MGSQRPKMLGVTGRAGDAWVSPLNIYATQLELFTSEVVPAVRERVTKLPGGALRPFAP